MKISNYFIFTYRNISLEIKLLSNKYLFKSGLINQISNGIYIYFPLCFNIIKKIIFFIRNEIEKLNFSELLLPSIQPVKLFKISQRILKFKSNLFYINKDKKLILSPTNEEILTFFLKDKIKNYNLPIKLYQISNKFRNELRSNLGLFRNKEFLMKDAYSLSIDVFNCKKIYEEVYCSYVRILNKLNLNYKIVLSKDKLMKSFFSHEFFCFNDFVNYNNLFKFSFFYNLFINNLIYNFYKNFNLIYLPNLCDFFLFSKYLKFNILNFIKLNILVFNLINNKIFLKFIYIRINFLELNNNKNIKNYYCNRFLIYRELIKIFNFNYNYVGLNFKFKIKLFVDKIIKKLNYFFISFGKKNYILNILNNNIYNKYIFKKKKQKKEIAHIFQLHDFYSKKFNLKIRNKSNKSVYLLMNSYGIGVSRLISVLIEQNFDKNGIIWPLNICPFKIVLCPLGYNYINIVKNFTDKLYVFLNINNIDVILDDRTERLGIVLTDWDLIGVLYKLIISEKNLKKNKIEYIYRKYLFSNFFDLKYFFKNFIKKLKYL